MENSYLYCYENPNFLKLKQDFKLTECHNDGLIAGVLKSIISSYKPEWKSIIHQHFFSIDFLMNIDNSVSDLSSESESIIRNMLYDLKRVKFDEIVRSIYDKSFKFYKCSARYTCRQIPMSDEVYNWILKEMKTGYMSHYQYSLRDHGDVTVYDLVDYLYYSTVGFRVSRSGEKPRLIPSYIRDTLLPGLKQYFPDSSYTLGDDTDLSGTPILIESAGFQTRTLHCLQGAEIVTVRDLFNIVNDPSRGIKYLHSINNVGKTTIKEIVTRLEVLKYLDHYSAIITKLPTLSHSIQKINKNLEQMTQPEDEDNDFTTLAVHLNAVQQDINKLVEQYELEKLYDIEIL